MGRKIERKCSVCDSPMIRTATEYKCSFCTYTEPLNGRNNDEMPTPNTTSNTTPNTTRSTQHVRYKKSQGELVGAIVSISVLVLILILRILGVVLSHSADEQMADERVAEARVSEQQPATEEAGKESPLNIEGAKPEYGIYSSAMQQTVEAMFQKPFDEVTKEELQSVKYLAIENSRSEGYCKISYSFVDYRDYLSEEMDLENFGLTQEFGDTINTCTYEYEDASYSTLYTDAQSFLNVTALNLDDYNDVDLSLFTKLGYIDCTREDLGDALDYGLQPENIEVLLLEGDENIKDIAQFTSLKKLYLEGCLVEELEYLSACKNLETLFCINLSGQTSFNAIGQLTGLKTLYIDGSSDGIKDLSMIENLTKLEHLTILDTDILNINFLAGFSGLKSLSLGENGELRDFTVIGDLTGLESLNLDLNALHGEQPEYQEIGNLKNLKHLSLNTVYELDFLYGLTNLEELEIRIAFYNNLLEPIGQMSHLKKLRLAQCDFNKPDEFAILKELPELTELTIAQAEIKDAADSLFQLDNLEEFHLESCKFYTAPAFIAPNEKLKVLEMSFVEFITMPESGEYRFVGYNDEETMKAVLNGYGQCTNLEEVCLDGCLVPDFSFLHDLNALKVLSMERCEVANIEKEDMAGCTMLEVLNLKDNTISNLDFATNLLNLKEINLENGYVTDLTPLASCEKLEYVNIKANPIAINPLIGVVVEE